MKRKFFNSILGRTTSRLSLAPKEQKAPSYTREYLLSVRHHNGSKFTPTLEFECKSKFDFFENHNIDLYFINSNFNRFFVLDFIFIPCADNLCLLKRAFQSEKVNFDHIINPLKSGDEMRRYVAPQRRPSQPVIQLSPQRRNSLYRR